MLSMTSTSTLREERSDGGLRKLHRSASLHGLLFLIALDEALHAIVAPV
jgi:hypothetical protein